MCPPREQAFHSLTLPRGLHYDRHFVSKPVREEILEWLATIHPIWEQRYAPNHPPPPGKDQRWLLRPVYWLGNWQFACLDYYHPPRGILHRCVEAEPFPPVLAKLVAKTEKIARQLYRGPDMPTGWHLNTCLVNFYGSRIEGDRRIDTARVGDHKDFEPGPVASLSLGERAFFQFVSSSRVGERGGVAFQQWLDDGSLQIFGGDRWKKQLFHRVQRVDRKGSDFALHAENFVTRRINFTFRYVPDEHIVPYAKLPAAAAEDVRGYMEQLAVHSPFFQRALSSRGPLPSRAPLPSSGPLPARAPLPSRGPLPSNGPLPPGHEGSEPGASRGASQGTLRPLRSGNGRPLRPDDECA